MVTITRPAKSFSQSRTIRVNVALAAIAGFLATLPDTVQTPPLSNLVAFLPEHYRTILAAVIGVIASVNVALRLITTQPVNAPQLPSKSNAPLVVLAMTALLVFTSCGTGSGNLVDLNTTQHGWTLPSIASIATPDEAESAVFIGVKAYELYVGSINAAFTAHKITDARYDALVRGPNSSARLARTALTTAFDAVERWRTGGDKTGFSDAWGQVSAGLGQLQPEGAK